MASEVQICNYALSKVGAEPITALTDNNKRAKLCAALLPRVLEDFVASHPWNFSTRRVQLAASATAPVFGWEQKYSLPLDCLRVFSINDNISGDVEYVIEGRYLLINESEVYIKYASSDYTVGDIPPAAVKAISFALAEELAYPMTNSDTLSSSLEEKKKLALKDARVYDAQEGNKDDMYRSTWTDARL